MLYLNKSDGSTLTVDWGDGSTTFYKHRKLSLVLILMLSYGDYEVKMWISSGSGTYGFGNGNIRNSSRWIQTQRDMLLYAFVGDSVNKYR